MSLMPSCVAFRESLAMPIHRLNVIVASALLCACSPIGGSSGDLKRSAANVPAAETQIERGLAFVSAQCGGCHAIRHGSQPPNPQAPSFVAVANDMGFTDFTLREFFSDGHDTPTAMTIKLEEEDAEIATAYIMSLRASP
jgi:mono/diheme cytochrome c family protein